MTQAPLSLDRPFQLDDPLDMEESRSAYRRCAELRRATVDELRKAHIELNEAEREYRKQRAARYVANRDAPSAGARDAFVDDESADQRKRRDDAASWIIVLRERLEQIDADRQSLNRLVEYSIAIFRSHEPARPELVGRRAA